jgi:hypothetical protein
MSGSSQHELSKRETLFSPCCLADAIVKSPPRSRHGEASELSLTQDEPSTVLNYIGEHQLVHITIDVVENAINELLGWDRFIEP